MVVVVVIAVLSLLLMMMVLVLVFTITSTVLVYDLVARGRRTLVSCHSSGYAVCSVYRFSFLT